MEYLFPILLVLLIAAAMLLRDWIARPRKPDIEAIEKYIQGRGLRSLKISVSGNYWRYWLRGKLNLSNVSRMYVVDVTGDLGDRRRLHLAFDPMRSSEGLILLQDEELRQ